MTSRKRILDLDRISPRTPPNARIASSTRLAPAAYKPRNQAVRTTDPGMLWADKSWKLMDKTYTNSRTMDTSTACCWERAFGQKPQKRRSSCQVVATAE
jgi:hypothetical protein